MNILELPSHIWAWSSAVIVAATAAVSAFITAVVTSRHNRTDGLSALVDQLQEEVGRLAGRVDDLERTRDAYRSWSHVLWSHIHHAAPDAKTPTWPIDLPR